MEVRQAQVEATQSRMQRRMAYAEDRRKILAEYFSTEGGVLTHELTNGERRVAEMKMQEAMNDLELRYLDCVREDLGLKFDDNKAMFGPDWDKRFHNLVKEYIQTDAEGKPTKFYVGADKKFRVIPYEDPSIKDIPFVSASAVDVIIPQDDDPTPGVILNGGKFVLDNVPPLKKSEKEGEAPSVDLMAQAKAILFELLRTINWSKEEKEEIAKLIKD